MMTAMSGEFLPSPNPAELAENGPNRHQNITDPSIRFYSIYFILFKFKNELQCLTISIGLTFPSWSDVELQHIYVFRFVVKKTWFKKIRRVRISETEYQNSYTKDLICKEQHGRSCCTQLLVRYFRFLDPNPGRRWKHWCNIYSLQKGVWFCSTPPTYVETRLTRNPRKSTRMGERLPLRTHSNCYNKWRDIRGRKWYSSGERPRASFICCLHQRLAAARIKRGSHLCWWHQAIRQKWEIRSKRCAARGHWSTLQMVRRLAPKLSSTKMLCDEARKQPTRTYLHYEING